jgi:hypothetical protein
MVVNRTIEGMYREMEKVARWEHREAEIEILRLAQNESFLGRSCNS